MIRFVEPEALVLSRSGKWKLSWIFTWVVSSLLWLVPSDLEAQYKGQPGQISFSPFKASNAESVFPARTGAVVLNDRPCQALEIPNGVWLSASNENATADSDPPDPSCWLGVSSGHSVWFRFIAPSSVVWLRTLGGSLANTQLGLYTDSCSMPQVLACNDDMMACGGGSPEGHSSIYQGGLVAGSSYLIRIDGFGGSTGSFSLGVFSSSLPPPGVWGQECNLPLRVCDTIFETGDPGFSGYGSVCDFQGGAANCLLEGERGSAWIEFETQATGWLEFSIVPRDWTGPSSALCTDYDFAIWKTGGAGSVNCSQISLGSAPLRCNYSQSGICGLFGSVDGTAPSSYPGMNSGFNRALGVQAGEKYRLLISNYTGSQSGFKLIFSGGSPLAYGGQDTAFWLGTKSSDWYDVGNWGNCQLPSATVSAVITASAQIQPELDSGTVQVKHLILTPGSQLRLGNAVSLELFGNALVQGELIQKDSAFVYLKGSSNQALSGNLVLQNSFPNLILNKNAGTVSLLHPLMIRNKLVLSNASDILLGNGKTITCSGSFLNNGGQFVPGPSGTLVLTTGGISSYKNNGLLRNCKLNASGRIELLSDLKVDLSGRLEIYRGILSTGSYRVIVENTDSSAVESFSSQGFVEGELVRRLLPAASRSGYAFPVGSTSGGLQEMNFDFPDGILPGTISLSLKFTDWGSALPVSAGFDAFCGESYSSPVLNNGYWTIKSTAAAGQTVLARLLPVSSANSFSKQTLQGKTDSSWFFPATQLPCMFSTELRRGPFLLPGQSADSMVVAVAQGTSVLPVTFLSFTARLRESGVLLEWYTASETGNRGFLVYRSEDGVSWDSLTWVQGSGNSSQIRQYSTLDDSDLQPGKYYYQLKQVDFDGRVHPSPIVAVEIGADRKVFIQAIPNPFSGSTRIRYVLNEESAVGIEIYDSMGRRVFFRPDQLEGEGVHEFIFSAGALEGASQMYYLILRTAGQLYTLQVSSL